MQLQESFITIAVKVMIKQNQICIQLFMFYREGSYLHKLKIKLFKISAMNDYVFLLFQVLDPLRSVSSFAVQLNVMLKGMEGAVVLSTCRGQQSSTHGRAVDTEMRV